MGARHRINDDDDVVALLQNPRTTFIGRQMKMVKEETKKPCGGARIPSSTDIRTNSI